MNKIVLEHYPVDRLPEDVRKHFSTGSSVTLEVREETPQSAQRRMSAKETIELIRNMRKRNVDNLLSQEEIISEIRTLRDEWDD